MHAGRRLFSTLGDMEYVATRRLDEQRLLGAEVVSNLARKGIGRASDRGDGGAIEAVRLEERARRVEEAGTHALARGARCARPAAGLGRNGRATARILRSLAPPCPVSVISDFGHRRATSPRSHCLYTIQINTIQINSARSLTCHECDRADRIHCQHPSTR